MSGQKRVTTPAVSLYYRSKFYRFTYKWNQAVGRYIRDSFHSYSSISLRVMDFKGNNHDFLAFSTSTSFSLFFHATNVSFINFDVAMKKISAWSNHRTAQDPGAWRDATAKSLPLADMQGWPRSCFPIDIVDG